MNLRRYATLPDVQARRLIGFVGLVVVAGLVGLAAFGGWGQKAINVVTFLFLTWLFIEQGKPCSCSHPTEDDEDDEEEDEEFDTDVFARIYDKEFFGYTFNFVEREEEQADEETTVGPGGPDLRHAAADHLDGQEQRVMAAGGRPEGGGHLDSSAADASSSRPSEG